MSILFFDRLVVLKGLDKRIKNMSENSEERQELWQLVEEIIHHRVLGCCLDHLPNDNHDEFLEMFTKGPYNPKLLKYLDEKTKKDMKKIIKEEINNLSKELKLLEKKKK